MGLKDEFAKKKLRNQEKKAQQRGELTPAEKLMNQGAAYYQQGRYAEALECLNRVIELNPTLAAAYCNRGFIYVERKNYEKALVDFYKTIQLNTQYALAYSNIGFVYKEQKNYTKASVNYDQSIKLNPYDAVLYSNRGSFYVEQENYIKALSDYEQALQLNPQCTQAYLGRGFIYKKQKNYIQALADYDKAIRLNPQLAEAYIDRGLVYSEQKNNEKALSDYNKAIELNPKYSDAYATRGVLHDKQKNYALALADYNKAIDLNPNLAGVYVNRGFLYEEQKNYTLALADYNKAIELNPNSPEAYNNRGSVCMKLNNAGYRRFILLFCKFLHLPNYFKIRAQRDFTHALELKPNTELAKITTNNLARVEFDKGNLEAYALLKEHANPPTPRQSYQIDGLSQQIQITESLRLLSRKEFQESRTFIHNLISEGTGDPEKLRIYLENIDHAEKLYSKAQELEKINKKLSEAHKKHEKLLREFTHMLANTLFPETVLEIAQSLKAHEQLREYAKRLYDTYHSELAVRRQGELLRARYFNDNPHRFIELIQAGCLATGSAETGSSVMDILESALERMAARLLNEHYDKFKTARQSLLDIRQADLTELRGDFEAHVFLDGKPAQEWINRRLMPLTIEHQPSAWARVRFKKGGTTESLLYNYFNELLLNAVKYADYRDGLHLRFYQASLDETLYLYFSLENTVREGIVSGTQIGLEGLREDLAQLNSADTPEKTLQVTQENGRFKVVLAFDKEILLYEPAAEQDTVIKNSFKRMKELEKQRNAA